MNSSGLLTPAVSDSKWCRKFRLVNVCATYGCTLKRSLYFHLFYSSLKLCQTAQPCTRPLLNNLAKNLWSRYRGKRAGRSTKIKEAYRTYKITQVNPRPKDHSKAKINSRGHDPYLPYLHYHRTPIHKCTRITSKKLCSIAVSIKRDVARTKNWWSKPRCSKC